MKVASTNKILLVQSGLGDSVALVLERQGYRVVWANNSKSALAKLASNTPSLVIIDVPTIRANVEKLCQSIKRQNPDLPILLILEKQTSNNGARHQKKFSFADAWIARPLNQQRLMSKIEKLLPEGTSLELRCGDLVFHPAERILRKKDTEQYLNPKLAKLLQIFMQRPGDLVTRKELMQRVWETSYLGDTRTLDVHIHWLREAIEDDPNNPYYLQTVRGQGYRFDDPKKRKR